MPTRRKPLILISGSTEKRGVEFDDLSLSLSHNYPRAIQAGGGLPWVAPCLPDKDFVAESIARCDGVLLTGGDDIQPKIYRKNLPQELAKTVHAADPDRDLFELMLVDEVFQQRKPLLAICRGHQVLNVALGGTLIVDIAAEVPNALNHSRTDKKDKIVHEAKVEAGSLLAQTTGTTTLGVNSSHHQAVEKVAKPLRITAVSIDGIVEGLELRTADRHILPFLLAVQFHPERLFARHNEHLKIFKTFIAACTPDLGAKL
jgi:putative glutamine amidotransferase